MVKEKIKRLDDFVSNHSKIQNDLEDGTPVFSSVEFSINGACNRRCFFCPRVDEEGYPIEQLDRLNLTDEVLNNLN